MSDPHKKVFFSRNPAQKPQKVYRKSKPLDHYFVPKKHFIANSDIFIPSTICPNLNKPHYEDSLIAHTPNSDLEYIKKIREQIYKLLRESILNGETNKQTPKRYFSSNIDEPTMEFKNDFNLPLSYNKSLKDSYVQTFPGSRSHYDPIGKITSTTYENIPILHNPPLKTKKKKEHMKIEENPQTICDFIEMGKKYEEFLDTHTFDIDMNIVVNLVVPLTKLNKMIGMKELKSKLALQIKKGLLKLNNDDDFHHTVIAGPPGVGKTMVSKILAEIYGVMGILKPIDKKIKFVEASRDDLVGKFLGHTASQTREFIESCEGSVLFIDEVYSLGNPEKRDSFAKECIDMLNKMLSEMKNFVCIIAGYPKEIEESFFAYNPGLRRRFPHTYKIEKYNGEELSHILNYRIKDIGWEQATKFEWIVEFMKENEDNFPFFGGSIQNFVNEICTVHCDRVFILEKDQRKKITKEDIEEGYKLYAKNIKEKKKDMIPYGMYV